MHDKEQEIALMTDRFEKKIKSLQAELEERYQDAETTRETITSLNKKVEQLNFDLETMTEKKKNYHRQYDKYSKMSERLQNEKSQLEERQ